MTETKQRRPIVTFGFKVHLRLLSSSPLLLRLTIDRDEQEKVRRVVEEGKVTTVTPPPSPEVTRDSHGPSVLLHFTLIGTERGGTGQDNHDLLPLPCRVE